MPRQAVVEDAKQWLRRVACVQEHASARNEPDLGTFLIEIDSLIAHGKCRLRVDVLQQLTELMEARLLVTSALNHGCSSKRLR